MKAHGVKISLRLVSRETLIGLAISDEGMIPAPQVIGRILVLRIPLDFIQMFHVKHRDQQHGRGWIIKAGFFAWSAALLPWAYVFRMSDSVLLSACGLLLKHVA